MMAQWKLQNPEKEAEAIVLVYHNHVTEGSELMKDLIEKYLSSFVSKINPKSFRSISQGTLWSCFKISNILDCFLYF